jgi:hypothetical protein
MVRTFVPKCLLGIFNKMENLAKYWMKLQENLFEKLPVKALLLI